MFFESFKRNGRIRKITLFRDFVFIGINIQKTILLLVNLNLYHIKNIHIFHCTITIKTIIMDVNEISFENLPKAVAHLTNEIAEIKSLVQNAKISEPKEKRIPIGIEDVCKIIGKSQTYDLYSCSRRKIPCYKNGKNSIF